jgi:hypothetical protein
MEITIPNKVVVISESAFAYAVSLKSVTFDSPSSLLKIEKTAFFTCKKLNNVTLPNSLIQIGEKSFNSCTNMTQIHFPDSLVSIGSGAFENSVLTSISLPQNLVDIGDNAFKGKFRFHVPILNISKLIVKTIVFIIL